MLAKDLDSQNFPAQLTSPRWTKVAIGAVRRGMTHRVTARAKFKFCEMPPNSAAPRLIQGFTLLELLVVVAVLGLLAAFVAPRYFGQLAKSEESIARAQIKSLSDALDAYRIDQGRFPTTEEGLKALMEPAPNDSKWRGPYMRKAIPLDPWGRPYAYKSPGPRGGDFELLCLGRDGKLGGEGPDADLH